MLPLDLLLEDARILDVFRLRLFRGWCGLRGGRFAYVEEGPAPQGLIARERRSLDGSCLAPGLIDSHMHIESSLLTPRRFAEAVVPHGTTTVLADPHEVANAAGEAGLDWFIAASRGLALKVFLALPSCVPATSADIEWTPASFGPEIVDRYQELPEVLALGEVMDNRRLLAEAARPLPEHGGLPAMMEAALKAGLRVEGHAPTLKGMELSEYLACGAGSDHTLTNPAKLHEQLSKGAAVMLQMKSLTPEIAAAVSKLSDRSRLLLVTDDIEPSLLRAGHLTLIVARAVEAGLPPLEAWASATIRPAQYLGLDRGADRRGAVAPGWRADFLVLEELIAFPPLEVFIAGRPAARRGRLLEAAFLPGAGTALKNSAAAPLPPAGPWPAAFRPEDFRIPPLPGGREGRANAIRIVNQETSLTRLIRIRIKDQDGFPRALEGEEEDICLAAVTARNGSSRATAIISGLGLKKGAVATSFAHDSHNLLVVGAGLAEMAEAANQVLAMAGGIAVIEAGRRLARLPLPVCGLLSDEPWMDTAEKLEEVERALDELGMRRKRPFLMISLLSLSASPFTKLTDKGIVDTEARALIPFWT